MHRAVLVHQHPRHRPPRPFAPVRPAPRRRPHQAGILQGQAGHRVAELVAVPLDQLLVKVLHREAAVHLLVKRPGPGQLALRRTTRRRLADPTIQQPILAILSKPVPPATERPLAHTQHLRRFQLA